MSRLLSFVCAALLVAVASTAARADTLRLANGDTIQGKVVAVDDQHVTIESENFGRLVLPRAKVVGMAFGDAAPRAAAGKKSGEQPSIADVKIDPKDKPEDILRKLIPRGFDLGAVKEMARGEKPAANPEDVVRQLREAGGVDPAVRRELMMRIPGFTSPAVQGYFDKQVNGLMSGEISLGDIRNDAVKVRDQLEDLKKELGPSGQALDGYLGILNGFIQDTQSVPAKKRPKNPAEGKAKPRGARPKR